MKLDIRPAMEGGRVDFSHSISLRDLDFGGMCPFQEPCLIVGAVANRAQMLEFSAKVTTDMHLICDRCAEPFIRPMELLVERVLVEHMESESSEDIVVLDGSGIDLDELITPEIILAVEPKNLCSPHCMGLCPQCGKNLNDGPCGCVENAIDPRLAKLGDYFKKSRP